jgi:hypothetical protein
LKGRCEELGEGKKRGEEKWTKRSLSFPFFVLVSQQKRYNEMRAKWEFQSWSRSDAPGVENVSVFVNQMQLQLWMRKQE